MLGFSLGHRNCFACLLGRARRCNSLDTVLQLADDSLSIIVVANLGNDLLYDSFTLLLISDFTGILQHLNQVVHLLLWVCSQGGHRRL